MLKQYYEKLVQKVFKYKNNSSLSSVLQLVLYLISNIHDRTMRKRYSTAISTRIIKNKTENNIQRHTVLIVQYISHNYLELGYTVVSSPII